MMHETGVKLGGGSVRPEAGEPVTITEFLLARITEDEAVAKTASPEWPDADPLIVREWEADSSDVILMSASRVLAECDAKRRIVELHRRWPVLVERSEPTGGWSHDPGDFVYAASMRIEWLTQQQYREKFGDEPPTAPIIAAMAAVYDSHPDYDEAWRP